MKLRALVAVLGLLVACGVQPDLDDHPPKIEQVMPAPFHSLHGLYFKVVDDGTTYMEQLFERYLASDPSLAVPRDHELAFEHLDANRWRTYLLLPTVELDASSIAHVEETTDPTTERPGVLLDFTPAAAQQFGELTARIAGHKLAVLADGRVVSAPVIVAPITGGRAQVTFGAGMPR
jgi:preprotein translocase subunit SecD